MSTGDLIDDDPDIGAAVERILAKGPEARGDGAVREDERENRDDREPHEMQEDGDVDTRAPVEAKGKEQVEETAEGDEQFLEIPGETEDAEPTRVPLTEAAEAWQKLRQMDGDVAAAVTKAETEAYERQDKVVTAMTGVYQRIEAEARTALELMYQYMPQAPDRALLDTNPQEFYAQQVWYEDYLKHAEKVRGTIAQAQQGRSLVTSESEKMEAERENTRLARYIPEWARPETREAKRTEILSALAPKYGVSKEDFDGVISHKAWRMMADLAKSVSVQTKAPEIRKTVQEKAAKIVNGKLPPRDPNGSGRFVGQAREALRKSGSVDDAAALFMRSGLTRGL